MKTGISATIRRFIEQNIVADDPRPERSWLDRQDMPRVQESAGSPWLAFPWSRYRLFLAVKQVMAAIRNASGEGFAATMPAHTAGTAASPHPVWKRVHLDQTLRFPCASLEFQSVASPPWDLVGEAGTVGTRGGKLAAVSFACCPTLGSRLWQRRLWWWS
jgi:hypothetical protein